ncbi:hypothetical protein [Streptomyces geranii]|uniref:hypothetical protein n=1 Tax=Streptomyces geranii TaxID=2058923 RepID=UPI000D02E172|nr:hypothetical protein [Streptomyces geranii]
MTTRADMIDRLGCDVSSPTRTIVVEAHDPSGSSSPDDIMATIFGSSNFVETDDAYVKRAFVDGGEVWVDQLQGRFWSLHTKMPMGGILPILKEKIESHRELDWLWLPSNHLQNLWPGSSSNRVKTKFQGHDFLPASDPAQDLSINLSGGGAERLLAYISEEDNYRSAVSFDSVQVSVRDSIGRLDEAVHRMGRFAVTGDFEYHLQFVSIIVDRYRNLVELCEHSSLAWSPLDGSSEDGFTFSGGPISIRFSREIPDMEQFAASLFAARQPFRLWGIPQFKDDVVYVDAVDLHVGQQVRMEIGRQWMRVHLEPGGCGNAIARLVSNLQHRFDSRLEFVDPSLQSALALPAPAGV